MGRPRGGPETPAPRLRLSAQALIACMADMGFTISSGAFSEIESGVNLPRDPARFLDAVSVCLKLSPADRQALVEQLAYDILRAKLGDELAQRVVRRWRDEDAHAHGAAGAGDGDR